MNVLLKRAFFIGGTLYAPSQYGTEVPNQIDGKPVVFADEVPEGECVILPEDAERIGDTVKPEAKSKDEPMALSELNKKDAKPQTFTEAMDKK